LNGPATVTLSWASRAGGFLWRWSRRAQLPLTDGAAVAVPAKIVSGTSGLSTRYRKFLTRIVVGVIRLIVPIFYGRNKEALKEYL